MASIKIPLTSSNSWLERPCEEEIRKGVFDCKGDLEHNQNKINKQRSIPIQEKGERENSES